MDEEDVKQSLFPLSSDNNRDSLYVRWIDGDQRQEGNLITSKILSYVTIHKGLRFINKTVFEKGT